MTEHKQSIVNIARRLTALLLAAALAAPGLGLSASAFADTGAGVENTAVDSEVGQTPVQGPAESREETAPTQPREEPPTQPREEEPIEVPQEGGEDADAPREQETAETPNGVPLYFQTDYPDVMYGAGTIETSGCSITCLAMVATALTGHTYLPDELAEYFGGCADNNIARLEYGSEKMQLPFEKSPNWNVTWKALQEGKIVIALMGPKSIFTDSQHFIVLTGLNEEGRIVVNDPYEPNYDHWQLKNAFSNGFGPNDILLGYSGAWIYDPEAMPEEPFLYQQDRLDTSYTRYPGINLTAEERELMASVIWVEAQGESAEGQQAVAEVILNRLYSDRYPNTLRNVIYAENQFRSVPYLKDAEPTQAQYQAIDRAIYGPYVRPDNVFFFATYAATDNVWGKIGNHIFCY